MKKSAMFLSFGVLVVLGLSAGCGGQKLPDGMPDLYPTVITLTVDGAPYSGAMIYLHPTAAGDTARWSFNGITNEAGKAVIKAQGSYDGAPEGEMKVCIQAERNVEGPTSKTERPNDDYNALVKWDAAVLEERQTFLVAGKEYGEAATTPLTMTIKKGSNEATFDIKDDGTQIK